VLKSGVARTASKSIFQYAWASYTTPYNHDACTSGT
jgi:hypothetical protein